MASASSTATVRHAAQIDARGPRFGAAITAVLLLVVCYLALTGPAASTANLGQRVADPAFILLAVLTVLFAWGAAAGVRKHPYGLVFRHLVQPRLGPAHEFEDAAPPTFAQFVGFVVSLCGLVLAVLAVPNGLLVAAVAAFIAAFLNAAFGYCLGCQLYLVLARVRPSPPA